MGSRVGWHGLTPGRGGAWGLAEGEDARLDSLVGAQVGVVVEGAVVEVDAQLGHAEPLVVAVPTSDASHGIQEGTQISLGTRLK